MTKEIKTESSKIINTVDLDSPALAPQLLLVLKPEALEPEKGRIKKREDKVKKSGPKFWIVLALGGATLLWSLLLHAETRPVPHLLNFQSALTDAAGRPLADGMHTLHFRIADAEGLNLYEETQSLESSNGIVSAMIGAEGELTPEFFETGKPLFLGVQVEGGGPETLLELASVPFAMTAEKALSAAPKSITRDMLADEVLESLGPVLLTDSGAAKVGVETNFIYSRGPTVQTVLKDFDTAIHQRQVNLEREKAALANSIVLQQSQIDVRPTVEEVDRMISSANNDLAASVAQREDALEEMINERPTVGAVNQMIATANGALPKIAATGHIDSGNDPSCVNVPRVASGYNMSGVSRAGGQGASVYRITFSSNVTLPYIVVGNAVNRPDYPDADNMMVVPAVSVTSDGFSVEMRNGGPGSGGALCDVDFNFIVVQGP